MRRRAITLMAFALVAGCSSAPVPRAEFEAVTIPYDVLDQPDQARFEVRYQNDTDRQVCVSDSGWPSSTGKLDFQGDRVFVQIDDQKFYVEDFNTGFSFGDRQLRVKPGDRIVGHLSYQEFRLPEQVWKAQKTLTLALLAHFCSGDAPSQREALRNAARQLEEIMRSPAQTDP